MNTENTRFCDICGKEFPRCDLSWTYDCQGIVYRLACPECWEKAMEDGYDGEYYTEADECLDWDY